VVVLVTIEQEASMWEVSTIGLDLAKRVFQAHGPDAESNPLPDANAAARGRRDGTARARLQPHPRRKHNGTGPTDCSNQNIGG
jgi:hypothetical protein